MKHAQILARAEKAISDSIDIAAVTLIDKLNITDKSADVVPGKVKLPGEYGVVDLRLLLPINESA